MNNNLGLGFIIVNDAIKLLVVDKKLKTISLNIHHSFVECHIF
jgi:hypothetical protein